MTSKKLISVDTVQQHEKADDCWLVINGNVWDLTEFAPKHPGGLQIILKYAGRSATSAYNEIHSPSLIHQELPSSKLVGTLDKSTLTEDFLKAPLPTSTELAPYEKPPLHTLINSYDFEAVAARTATPKTWAFYSSAATDCYTRDANKSMYDRIWLRPRVLRDVQTVSTRARILGQDMEMPIFVSPAAMAGMMHADGEKAISVACAHQGIFQCISTSASFPFADIIAASPSPKHPYLFQLYINRDRASTTTLLHALSLHPQITAILLTVDAPVTGKREADERLPADETLHAPMSNQRATNDTLGGGMGRVMGAYIDASITWREIAWIRQHTRKPLLLKGIQTAADAKLAVQHGVQGIVVSNHGGRCLDTSPPSILALLDIQRNAPEVFEHLQVFVDGGIRRGTDVIKALALGASGVGLGRPFLYALAYGEEGVRRLVEVLREEVETGLRLLGVTCLADLHPGLVNTGDVDRLVPVGCEEEGHPYARSVRRARL